MLTKKEKEFIEKLIAKEGVKGKKLLKKALWYNTVTPKFAVGDKVTASARGMYICDTRVKDWDGVVTKVLYYYGNPKGQEFGYMIDVRYEVNGVQKTTSVCSLEYEVKKRTSKEFVHSFTRDRKTQKYDECFDAGIYL